MNKKKIGVIILAGGKGRRMACKLPKVLIPVNGKTMLVRNLQAVEEAGFGTKPIVVVGYKKELVKKEIGSRAFCVHQKHQLGTGHAVAQVAPRIKGKVNQVLVIYGDHPFITKRMLRDLSTLQQKNKVVLSLVTIPLPDFRGRRRAFRKWGRIVRTPNGKYLERCVEYKDATSAERKILEVNSGQYCFDAKWLWRTLPKLNNNNKQHEYYLTDLIDIAIKEGQRVAPLLLQDWRQGLGANTKVEIKIAEKLAEEL